MTTKRQIAANRRNAQKSTGPRTEEGKERSSQNAVKHGMTSRRAVLADEDPKVFLAHRISIHEDLRPMGELETTLANRIAAQLWRLARVPAIEAELIDALRPNLADGSPGKGSLGVIWEKDGLSYGGGLGRLTRYETALERSLMRLQAEFRRVQERRHKLEAAEMKHYEHESDRYVVGGMEALDRNPDGSYPRPGESGGSPAAGLRNEADFLLALIQAVP